MPLVQTRGAASAQGFGEFAQTGAVNYIEDVFSCFLYTGNGSTQTINNGIDLAGKGGLVWTGRRTTINRNTIYDTSRTLGGFPAELRTNLTDAQAASGSVSSFNSNGYSLTNDIDNTSGASFVSWTFRKQPKFFDVVTYTGDGNNNRAIAHSLGSTPGSIIVKRTSSGFATGWAVWHRATNNGTGNAFLFLNLTNAQNTTGGAIWGDATTNSYVAPTSTNFTVSYAAEVNSSGATYVAYLFAHDAGGFGLSGTDNVISCGSFTTNGSGIIPTVNLGWEPQWILAKPSSGTGNWFIMDNMRSWYNQQADQGNSLFPNTSGAEAVGYSAMIPTATGFTGPNVNFGAGVTYIYIAIRRGPMKVPTLGTSVFAPSIRTGTGTTTTVSSTSFPPDLYINGDRTNGGSNGVFDRLRGRGILQSFNTAAENATSPSTYDFVSWGMNGEVLGEPYNINMTGAGRGFVDWNFGRAPSFFDVVCYTGTGVARTVAHNLAAVPELMIVKARNLEQEWDVYAAPLGATKYLRLDTTFGANVSSSRWNNTTPSSTNFTVGTDSAVNANTYNYVAYLFASAPGVSKVGSYTGTGTTLQIDCGFTAGARFVLIKRTDDAGFAWYVWDSARGIVAGNDPYLLLNSTAAEVTNTDFVDTAATGFEISSTAPAAINASGGTFIFLAIA